MLNVIHLIDTSYTEVNGKMYHNSVWNCSVQQVLAMNRDKDVYIYRPSLHNTSVMGFTVKKLNR